MSVLLDRINWSTGQLPTEDRTNPDRARKSATAATSVDTTGTDRAGPDPSDVAALLAAAQLPDIAEVADVGALPDVADLPEFTGLGGLGELTALVDCAGTRSAGGESTGTAQPSAEPAGEATAYSDRGTGAAGTRTRRESDELTRELLAQLYALPRNHPDHRRIRDRVIGMYLPMTRYLARRFRNRGEPFDDLAQVATVGLIKAVDGYDITRGVAFTSYAIPTVVGELKRHFRDRGWCLRVPRRLQELKLDVARAAAALSQELGRSPTVPDIARSLGISEEDVLAGLETSQAYAASSLNSPVVGDDSGAEVGDLIGAVDPEFESIDDRETLRPLISTLPERERRILAMRFFGNMTQSQIAKEIGISQMHVSRLLSRSLSVLRQGMLAEA